MGQLTRGGRLTADKKGRQTGEALVHGRGELRCIGATTLDEYRTHIEKDPALVGCRVNTAA